MSFDVSVVEVENGVVATINPKGVDPNADYAFYILKDDKRVFSKWYSKDSSVHYDTSGQSGFFRVAGFVKSSSGNVEFKYSNFLVKMPPAVDLSSLSDQELSGGAFQVAAGGFNFPCLFYPGSEDRLFVLLSAAIDRKKVTPPVFNRWKWASRFPGHVLCIADPTLSQSSSLQLGWYLGNEQTDAMDGLKQLVVHMAGVLGLSNERIISYGSSGGGFAALALAARIPGATAVAINAQTIATRFDARAVKEMLNTCFKGATPDEALVQFSQRLSMVSVYEEAKTLSHVLLIQNIVDSHHYDEHYKPLANVLGLSHLNDGPSEDGRHFAILFENENGHGPEPDSMVEKIVKKAIELSLVDD